MKVWDVAVSPRSPRRLLKDIADNRVNRSLGGCGIGTAEGLTLLCELDPALELQQLTIRYVVDAADVSLS